MKPSPIRNLIPLQRLEWILPRSLSLALILALSSQDAGAAGESGPLSPEAEQATFSFADARLRTVLVASEPLVESPVAMAWDEELRLYVAEMRDYPSAGTGGRVRLLRDRDGDGRYEEATIFADALPFPNSVLPWRGGVLVTAAPDVWFLRDTDGDDRADERTLVLTGLGTGNQQLRANGLQLGPDGWIYAANGRSDGKVRAPGQTNVWSIRGRDFRFRWDGRVELETLAGRSQFGLAVDPWGNRFLSWNTIPLRHEVFPDRHLDRNPGLAGADVLQDCLPPGDTGEVFPLTPAPLVFNNESAAHFNALSGLHLYGGDALGAGFRGNAFVGESLRNLVHRRVLAPDGPTFRAERAADEVHREFLASRDPWFHPVNFTTGPDGALYIADFYRRLVEHPDWVAKEMRDKVAWDAGKEHGRIWRIAAAGTHARANPLPRTLRTDELATRLDHPNAWQRGTAQRLLLERRDPGAIRPLRRLVAAARNPEASVAALHLLRDLGGLDPASLDQARRSRTPGVRAVAIMLTRTTGAALESGLADPDPGVRLAAVLALGNPELPDNGRRARLLERFSAGTTNRWLRLAAASGAGEAGVAWWTQARDGDTTDRPRRARPTPPPSVANPDRKRVVEQFRPALGLAGDRSRGGSNRQPPVSRLPLRPRAWQAHRARPVRRSHPSTRGAADGHPRPIHAGRPGPRRGGSATRGRGVGDRAHRKRIRHAPHPPPRRGSGPDDRTRPGPGDSRHAAIVDARWPGGGLDPSGPGRPAGVPEGARRHPASMRGGPPSPAPRRRVANGLTHSIDWPLRWERISRLATDKCGERLRAHGDPPIHVCTEAQSKSRTGS